MYRVACAVVILVVIIAAVHRGRLSCNCKAATAAVKEQLIGGKKMINLNRVVTYYYTNWCPHCKVMRSIWDQVVVACEGSGIVFEESDEEINKTPGISGFPTILMITETGARAKYDGVPDFKKLRDWVVSPIVRRI